MRNYIKYMALSAVLLTACEAELDNPIEDGGVYTSGSADFSNFVSVGNSLTSGYADGALYLTGQQNSFPNILAGQFALAGGGEFKQPLVNDNLGGLLAGGNQITENRFVLSVGASGNPGPVRLSGSPTTDISNVLTGPFNNMGVPGAKSFHLVAPGYGNIAGVAAGASNPYFVRFASSANATIIADAAAQSPTFFSLWIGNNDVLSYATSGGVGVNQNGNLDPSTYGANDITD
ncbi:MAG: G-D-S-L family lipolytic protein, partial [Leeuwenhoekiella sp.]|nr:G-D-S-L family lipolytic protein [Leeuwenhoekiella sp.]